MTVPEMTDRAADPPRPGWRESLTDVSTPTMVVLQIILGVAFLALWQWSSGRLVDEFMISSPLAVGERLWGWIENGTIWVNIWATVHATLVGFLIGAVAGVVGGVWLGLSPFLSRLLNPYIWAFNALPKVALAPLFLLWFGLGIESKIALAAVLVVFLVFVNTFSGVREVDPDLTDCLLLMGATRSQILTRVVLPSATSWIFVGLKTAVPYALIGAIIGELIAANRGLGYLVQLAGSEFDTAGVFAALIVIAILAVVFNEAVSVLQRRLERWKVLSR
ncbi:NitT/TauT family transport system permease protein [Rhodoligotrophos appendicifer]|uniref:ABC transporter permease n=1 Tax=Rhodoligotrophos appendicifer TaxID=987056 RepID=UPI001FEC0DC5|nr:ABC transporter permease [Rhodoligotrophos appendicifer]